MWIGVGGSGGGANLPSLFSIIIYKTGSITYAINRAGTTISSNANTASVINAAINSLASGLIYICGANYNLSSPIVTKPNISIVCEPFSTIFTPTANVDMVQMVQGSIFSGATLRPADMAGWNSSAIKLSGEASNWKFQTIIESIRLVGGSGIGKGRGIYFESTASGSHIHNATVRDIVINGFEHGIKIYADNTNGSWINSNQFEDCRIEGSVYGVHMTTKTPGGWYSQIDGNVLNNVLYQFSSGDPTITAVYAGGHYGRYDVMIWDWTLSTPAFVLLPGSGDNYCLVGVGDPARISDLGGSPSNPNTIIAYIAL